MEKFVDRVAKLPDLLHALWFHPEGLRIDDLAAEFGAQPAEVRETLLAYYRADLQGYASEMLIRDDVLEFFGGSADEEPVGEAPMVRLVAKDPTQELGVSYTTGAELTRLYRAGRDRLQIEPGNTTLASALEKLRAGLLPAVEPTTTPATTGPPQFREAVRDHRRVRITYARAWRPGVQQRVIEPYRMLRTRRGWEVDAGPVGEDGALRTFLLIGVQDFEVLDETFEPPADLDTLLARQRRLTAVELTIPHELRWAVDKYAERVDTLATDETTTRVRAHLLEPVAERVGLIMLAGRPGEVRCAAPWRRSGAELARRLLAHHEAPAGTSARDETR